MDLHAEHVNGAVLAIDVVFRRHHMLIDRRRVGNDLEHRARLVDIADGAVLQRLGRDVVKHIGIEGGPVRQRQNFAGARIFHHDGSRDRLGVLHALLEFVLGDVLDRLVDSQHQVLPGIGRPLHPAEPFAPGINRDQFLAGNAAQIVIELTFQPAQTFVVHADIAEHLRRQLALGIETFRFLAEINAAQIQLANAVAGFAVDLAFDDRRNSAKPACGPQCPADPCPALCPAESPCFPDRESRWAPRRPSRRQSTWPAHSRCGRRYFRGEARSGWCGSAGVARAATKSPYLTTCRRTSRKQIARIQRKSSAAKM